MKVLARGTLVAVCALGPAAMGLRTGLEIGRPREAVGERTRRRQAR